MDWKEISTAPKEKFGWFSVAILPKNHSGSKEADKDKCDLAGDNAWRKSFGFTKAWLNNGEWFEADSTGYKSNNITRFVTHTSNCVMAFCFIASNTVLCEVCSSQILHNGCK